MLKISHNSSLMASAGMRQLIVTQTKSPAEAHSRRQFSITKNRNHSAITNGKQYFLGANFPGKYFTLQEARCMFYFIQGYSYKKTAVKMQLSHPPALYCFCKITSRNSFSKLLISTAYLSHF